MADQTIEIRLILRDEISKAMEDAFSKMRRHDSGFTTQRGRQEMERFGGAVRVVHRELSTLARISLGGLVGGGIVAGIYQAAKALGEMSRQGLQLHYTAQGLGVSAGMIEKYSDAMMALGQSQEQGRQGIESAIGSLRDLQVEGNKSNIWQTLEKGKGGKELARELMAEMNGPRGMEGALRLLFSRMQNMNPEAQRSISKMFGLGTTGAKDLLDILPQLNKRVELSVPQMKALALANANFEISIGNIGRQLGSALMPGLTKVTEAFDKWLQTDAGQKVIKDLGTWASDVGEAIAKWIGDQGPNGLNANIEELKKGIAALKTAFNAADTVIKDLGLTWPELLAGVVGIHFGAWLLSVGIGLARIAPYVAVLTALATAANVTRNIDPKSSGNAARDLLSDLLRSLGIAVPEAGGSTTPGMSPTGPKEGEGFWDYIKRQLLEGVGITPQPQSGEETPKTAPEKRADLDEKRRNDKELTSEFKTLAYDLTKLNDRLMPGGPEGGKGPSGFQYLGGGYDVGGLMGVGKRADRSAKRGDDIHNDLLRRGNDWSPAPPPNLRGIQRAVERIAPDSAEEWALRTQHALGLAGRGAPEGATQGATPEGYGGGASLPPRGYVEKQIEEGTSGRYVDPGAVLPPLWTPEGYQYQYGRPGDRFNQWTGAPAGQPIGSRFSTITNSLAQRGMNGSATVDIDVGGVGQGGRDPDALFPPRPLGGAVQMQNTPRMENNPQSFQ